jgi:predicted DNA binding CopG/RHH family protein
MDPFEKKVDFFSKMDFGFLKKDDKMTLRMHLKFLKSVEN